MKEQTWADIELPCDRGTVEHSEKQQLSQRWKYTAKPATLLLAVLKKGKRHFIALICGGLDPDASNITNHVRKCPN